ncbi:MAG TPA: hypothetical protein VJ251_19955, partial [Stellaceae bacterium]|nr:hypothetical protein [Stellaceae bacterium]
MGDAGGQLAKRGELFGLHQAILCGAQILQRRAQIVGALAQLVQQPGIFDGDHGLCGETLHQRDLLFGERAHLLTIDADYADYLFIFEHRHRDQGVGFRKLDGRNARAHAISRRGGDVINLHDLAGTDEATHGALRIWQNQWIAKHGIT